MLNSLLIENFRSLERLEVPKLGKVNLIVGKNNCGKTSILSILEKIINKSSSLTWEDINLYHRKVIFENIKKVSETSDSELEPILGINLQIWIQYSDSDSYQNIQVFMMDLNPDNNFIILDFSYIVPIPKLHDLNTEISDFSDDFSKFESFMKKNMSKFFEMQINSRGYNPDTQKLTEETSD